MVVIGSLKIQPHFENSRLLLIDTLPLAELSESTARRRRTSWRVAARRAPTGSPAGT